MELLANIVGMFGTAAVVGSFVFLQLGKLEAKSLSYNVLNLVGAILLLLSLLVHFNLASFVIELFWIAASIVGLVKYFKQKKPSTNTKNVE